MVFETEITLKFVHKKRREIRASAKTKNRARSMVQLLGWWLLCPFAAWSAQDEEGDMMVTVVGTF